MGERRAFSSTEIREIKQFRKQGLTYRDIGVLMDRSMRSVQHVFDKDAPALNRTTHFGPVQRMRPAREAIEERDRRRQLEPRDLTARLMGDPPKGFSALERK